MSLVEKLQRLRTGQPAEISRFAASLDPTLLEQCLTACGKASMRTRKLPAAKAIWVVIGMALFSDSSIQRVIEHLGLVINGIIASSVVTRARAKLGPEPIRWLFECIAKTLR